ncbi:Sortilin, neurotensin receptor 3 [Zobellia uliginosa]|uniref:Sortilin, neurotensin receptor 3 n=1 Tax=Zobellia uliginosa TaxID=143224 RepID=A0ABY1KM40_9FLAO|nr:sialidase family protein [Zobellia uliginosa]SIS49096.1 Sortilin, neurotensin receptor 3 [Zobellia uliginosa]
MNKKMIAPKIALLFTVLYGISTYGQNTDGNKDFFKRLKTQDLASDPSVVWQQFGPGMSGNNKCAFWHPTDPNSLYISPNMGNSYVSFDQGKTYSTMLDEDATGYREGQRGPMQLFSIDFSRQNPDFGFCSDDKNKGIFVTHDRGRSWQNLNHPVFEGKYVSCVAVDPKNDAIWYAGGGEMRHLGRMLFPNSQPHGSREHKPSLNKLWKSTDKGKTWKLMNKGFHPNTQFETLLVDPKNSNMVYASTNYGFYKSTDGAKSWTQKTKGFDYDVMRAMAHHYDPSTNTLTLYVISNPMWKPDGKTLTDDKGGIFKSVDRGETWQKLQGNLALDMRQFQNSADIKKSYVHCAAYVFGMKDGEFKKKYPEMPSAITIRFNTIAVDPNDANNIYLNNEYSNASRNNFKPGQLWRSKDGGKTWHVALRNGKAWKKGSKDYTYWTDRGNPMETNISLRYLKDWVDRDFYERKGSNFVRWNADGTVLHTQMAKISLMSYDKGETWVDIDDEYTTPGTESYVGAGNSNLPGHGFYQHPEIKHKVFCMAGENSLWITNNEGAKVRPGAQAAESHNFLDNETSLSWYAIHPKDTMIHYALFFRQAAKGKFLKSIDNGKTWKEHGIAIPKWETQPHSGDQSVHQNHLIIDPNNPNNMYFVVPRRSTDLEWVGNSVTGFGVHATYDGGKTWQEANRGLPDSRDASKIAFDPEDPNTLYVAIQNKGGGLFKSIDKGKYWSKVSSTEKISGDQGINDIHFSRNGKAYITAGSKRGKPNAGGLWVSNDGLRNWKRIFDHPWTNRIETAYYNPNTILVSTLGNVSIGTKNAGTYLSQDGGKSWSKINKGNGQSDRINDIAIDNYTPGKFYASTRGSGWYVAQHPKPNKTIYQ